MCSSVRGMMTQSWWPPLLGQMPTNSSVSVSMKAIPLDSRWKPLNTPTRYLPSYVTASVCISGPMPWISFLIFQVLVSTTMTPLAVQDRQIELGAVHGEHHVERVRIFAHPQRILDVRDFLPIARVGIARIENRAIVLAQIVHHAEKASVGGESDLVAGREDLVERHLPMVVVDLLDGILVRRVLVE